MPLTPAAVHAYPECRSMWARLSSETQGQLLGVGTQLWADAESTVHESLPTALLPELEGIGLLVSLEGRWRFAVPEMPFFIQSINLIDSLELDSRPVREVLPALIGILDGTRALSFERFREYELLVSFAIAHLVNEHRRQDLLELALSEETSDEQFWQLYEAVCSVLPILQLDPESLVRGLVTLVTRIQGDLAGGQTYAATQEIGRSRPEFGWLLVDHLVRQEDQQTIGLLEALMAGIARSGPDQYVAVVVRCKGWLDSDRAGLPQAAIYCSQQLIIGRELPPEWLLSRADTLILKSDEIRYALSLAITLLGGEFSDRAEQCLVLLGRITARGPADRVAFGIAGSLSRVRGEGTLKYITSALSLLTDVPSAHRGTVQHIDHVLQLIARSCPAEAWQYLQRWVLGHDGQDPITERDMFLTSIRDARQQDLLLAQRVLTQWFASADPRLVEEARGILRELKMHSFDADEICGMSPRMIVYITEKLLVGHLEPMQLMSLFYSILRSTSHFSELSDYFLNMLRYLGWSYPSGASEFISRQVRNEVSAGPDLLLRIVHREIEEYQTQHRDLYVPELAPSRHRVEMFQHFLQRRMQSIEEAVFEDGRPSLLSLISRVAIGRGDRTLHMNEFHPNPDQRRTFTEPSSLGHFSESAEVLRGEVLDPEGEIWSRAQRLDLTPDQVQVPNE